MTSPKPKLNCARRPKTQAMGDSQPEEFTKHIEKYLSNRARHPETNDNRKPSKVSNETLCLLKWGGGLKNRSRGKHKARSCKNVMQAKASIRAELARKNGKCNSILDTKNSKDVEEKPAIRIDKFGDVTCLTANITDKKKKLSAEIVLDQRQKFKNPNLIVSLHSPPIKDSVLTTSNSESSDSEESVCSCSVGETDIRKQTPDDTLDNNAPKMPRKSSMKQKFCLKQSSIPHADNGVTTTWATEVKDKKSKAGFDKTVTVNENSQYTLGSEQSFVTEVCEDETFDKTGELIKINESPIKIINSAVKRKAGKAEDIYNPKYFAPAVLKACAQEEVRKFEEKRAGVEHVKFSGNIEDANKKLEANSSSLKNKSPITKHPAEEDNPGSNLQTRIEKKPPRVVINHQTEESKINDKKHYKNDVNVFGNNSLTMQKGVILKGVVASKKHSSKTNSPPSRQAKKERLKFLKRSDLKNFYKELQASGESDRGFEKGNESVESKSNQPINQTKKGSKIHETLASQSVLNNNSEHLIIHPEKSKVSVTKTTQTDDIVGDGLVYKLKLELSPEPKPVVSNKYEALENISNSPNRVYSPFSTHQPCKSTFRLSIGQYDHKRLLPRRHRRASEINDRFLDTRIQELNSYTDSLEASSNQSISSHQLLAQPAITQLVEKSFTELDKSMTNPIEMNTKPQTIESEYQQKEYKSSNNQPRLGSKDLKVNQYPPSFYKQQSKVNKNLSPQSKKLVRNHQQTPLHGNANDGFSRSINYHGKTNQVIPIFTKNVDASGDKGVVNGREKKQSSLKYLYNKRRQENDKTPEPKTQTASRNDHITPEVASGVCPSRYENNMITPGTENDRHKKELETDNMFETIIIKDNGSLQFYSDESRYNPRSYTVEHPTMAASPPVETKLKQMDDAISDKHQKNVDLHYKLEGERKKLVTLPRRTKDKNNEKVYRTTGKDRDSDFHSNAFDFKIGFENESLVKRGVKLRKLAPPRLQQRPGLRSHQKRDKQKQISISPSMKNASKSPQKFQQTGDKPYSLTKRESIFKRSEPKSPTRSEALSPKKTPDSQAKGDQDITRLKSNLTPNQPIKAKINTGLKTAGKVENDSLAKILSTYKMLHKNRSTSKQSSSLLPPKSSRNDEKNLTSKMKYEPLKVSEKTGINGNRAGQASQENVFSKKMEHRQIAKRLQRGRRMRLIKGGSAFLTPSVQTSATSRDLDTSSKWSDIVPIDTPPLGEGPGVEKQTLDDLLQLNRISCFGAFGDDSKRFECNDVDDIETPPLSSNSKDHQSRVQKNDLGSILSNLAYIEDLDSEEIEKLSLPQQLPDLIATSSGDSAGDNGIGNLTERSSKNSPYLQKKEKSVLLKRGDESLEVHRDNDDQSPEEIHIRSDESSSIDVDNITPQNDHGNEFETLYFVESLDAPHKTENRTNWFRYAKTHASPGNERHSVKNGKAKQFHLHKTLKDRLASNKMIMSDSKLFKNESQRKQTKPKSTLFGSKSCGHNFMHSAPNQQAMNSDFQTPKFQQIFSDKMALETWARANNIHSTTQHNFTSNHDSIKKDCFNNYHQQPTCSQTPEDLCLPIQHNSVKSNKFFNRVEGYKTEISSAQNNAISSECSTSTPKIEIGNVSWSETHNKDDNRHSSLSQDRGAFPFGQNIDNVRRNKSWLTSGKGENIEQNLDEYNSSSSDAAITWLGERNEEAFKGQRIVDHNVERQRIVNHNVEQNNFTNINVIHQADSLTNLKQNEAIDSLSTSRLVKSNFNDIYPSTETSITQSTFKGPGDEQKNVFLNMQRVKLSHTKGKQDKSDGKTIRMTSPPKQSRYVKSALSYSKKKRTSNGSSVVKSHETYCIEPQHGADGNPLTSSHLSSKYGLNPTVVVEGNEANVQLAKATKNNNKLPISFTSLYYSTQIDAIKNDSTMSGRQSHGINGRERGSICDNTSDDVSTAELCTTWASDRLNEVGRPEVPDVVFPSNRHSQTKKFVLDWYRPNLSSRPNADTTERSDVQFGSDSGELDYVVSDVLPSSNIYSDNTSAWNQINQYEINHENHSHPPNITHTGERLNRIGILGRDQGSSSSSRRAAAHIHLNMTANQRSLISDENSITKNGNHDIRTAFETNTEFCCCPPRRSFQERHANCLRKKLFRIIV